VNLYVDLETLQLIQGPGQRSAIASLSFKRGDSARLRVVFLESGLTPVTIGDPEELEIKIGIKSRNQYDRSYLAHGSDWSMPSEGDDTPTYESLLSLNTLQLNSALNVGSESSEELSEIALMGEITWREAMGEPTSTRTFLVVVENDVNRGTEGIPISADPAYPAPEDVALSGSVVRHDVAQALTLAAQLRARQNIGADHFVAEPILLTASPVKDSVVSISNVTLYSPINGSPLIQNTGDLHLVSVDTAGRKVYTSSGYNEPTGYRFHQNLPGEYSTVTNLTTGFAADFDSYANLGSWIWGFGASHAVNVVPAASSIGQLAIVNGTEFFVAISLAPTTWEPVQADNQALQLAHSYGSDSIVAPYSSDRATKTYLLPNTPGTLATQSYADALVFGLLDDRGNYNASSHTYPSSGGSGTLGAINKGDLWTISVAGTLGGIAVTPGDVVRALSDAPGQAAVNWVITENNIGYIPENSANKSSNVATDATSTTKYPTVKSLYDWAVSLFAKRREYKTGTGSFNAVAFGRYHTSSTGTIVVNNPTGTPTEGDMFDVLIASGNAMINNTTYAASRFPIQVVYTSGAWITPAANVTGTLAATTVSTSGDSVMNGVAFGRGSGVSANSQFNTVAGRDALKNNTTGQLNAAFGYNAIVSNTTGSVNTAMGYNSLLLNTSGNANTAIGVNSIFNNTSGGGNTAAGVFSLFNNTTGSNNTATGINSLYNNVAFSNATGIGSNSQVSASNQVQLGDSATTTYAYGALQNRSDIRDKADVRDTLLGLDFISLLRPVDYKWDMREDYRSEMPAVVLRPSDLGSDANEEDIIKYAAELAAYESYLVAKDEWLEASKLSSIVHNGSKKRNRYHHGLIAQEVKAVLDEQGMDFGGFQDHRMKGGDDVFSIGYAELIAPLIKSIQQLKARVEQLESGTQPVDP
jgi:hypothetical protein